MYRVLIADDERVIRGGLSTLLEGEGYEVFTAIDGEDAIAKFREVRPHLLLLDVMMPKLNGFVVCEQVRKIDPTASVIFLTARDGESDEVRGIELNAEDYISKSAPESVLLSRIARALRRFETDSSSPCTCNIGGVTVDLGTMEVSEGESLRHLTQTETDLLQILLSDRSRFFSKDELIVALRGNGFACLDEMLYTHIHRLRSKLGSGSRKIVCDRFRGYRLLP